MMASRFDKQCFRLTVLVVFICLVMCKSSSARPLISLADAQQVGSSAAAEVGEKARRAWYGGDEMGSPSHDIIYKNSLLKMEKSRYQKQELGGILGALVMNVLPKGSTPPSGPSRRNNGKQT